MSLQSSLLQQAGILHGFGDRSSPIPVELAQPWEATRPQWKQVHGTACTEVSVSGASCGEVDGLYSRRSGQTVGVVTADCVPVLLARKDGRAVAAVHAGWRGTRARILRRLWERLRTEGESPQDWIAAVGPSIGPCCYQVSEELAADFAKEFGSRFLPAHRMLDLPAINAEELKQLGLGAVEVLRACTFCTGGASPVFHSFRREGSGTRQYSLIQAR